MKHSKVFGLIAASAVVLAASGPARAQTYDWTLTGLDTGSGTFFTTSAANGGLNMVGFTGTIDGVSVTEYGGNPGTPTNSPSGYFIYDNIVYPGSNPVLDVDGILMLFNGVEANVWANSATPDDYAFVVDSATGPNNVTGDQFSIQFIPEPATAAIFGAGMLGLAFASRRRVHAETANQASA